VSDKIARVKCHVEAGVLGIRQLGDSLETSQDEGVRRVAERERRSVNIQFRGGAGNLCTSGMLQTEEQDLGSYRECCWIGSKVHSCSWLRTQWHTLAEFAFRATARREGSRHSLGSRWISDMCNTFSLFPLGCLRAGRGSGFGLANQPVRSKGVAGATGHSPLRKLLHRDYNCEESGRMFLARAQNYFAPDRQHHRHLHLPRPA
jgi:hypothetical protein